MRSRSQRKGLQRERPDQCVDLRVTGISNCIDQSRRCLRSLGSVTVTTGIHPKPNNALNPKYILFNTSTEKYLFSNTLPTNVGNFDIIDLENKNVLSGPTTGPLTEHIEEEDEPETQEIPTEEEREFDPEAKHDVAPDVENGDEA